MSAQDEPSEFELGDAGVGAFYMFFLSLVASVAASIAFAGRLADAKGVTYLKKKAEAEAKALMAQQLKEIAEETRKTPVAPPVIVVSEADKQAYWRGSLIRMAILGFCWMATVVSSLQMEESRPPFDPYGILEVPRDASQAVVRKAYRKFSLELHPDRLGAATEEVKKLAKVRFLRIAKAYKTLTDDEAMANWLQYGHPDGDRGYSFGVGLPKWMMNKDNAILVLGLYFVLIAGVAYGIRHLLQATAPKSKAPEPSRAAATTPAEKATSGRSAGKASKKAE